MSFISSGATPDLPQSSERSLAQENEFLKSELLVMRAELAKYRAQQPKITPSPTSAPLKKQKMPAFAASSAKHRTAILSKLVPQTKLHPIIKNNRHLSDDNLLGDFDYNEINKSALDVEIEMHESARGLKHRKPNSRNNSPHRRSLQSPLSINGRTLSIPKANGTYGTLVLPNSSDSSGHSIDVETSFLRDDEIAQLIAENAATELPAKSVAQSMKLECRNSATPSFFAAIKDRAGWLVGLLILQSMSSFIISRNETLLQNHLVIVRFLTMLVGAGGNAGNQASVGVIRGLATGSVNDHNIRETLIQEVKMGFGLAFVLGLAGAVRAAAFLTPITETLAITTCLVAIVFISVLIGAVLPLLMKLCRIDPAHSSTSIQVIMDILGVTITVRECSEMFATISDRKLPIPLTFFSFFCLRRCERLNPRLRL